jgi:hypothetical protein
MKTTKVTTTTPWSRLPKSKQSSTLKPSKRNLTKKRLRILLKKKVKMKVEQIREAVLETTHAFGQSKKK